MVIDAVCMGLLAAATSVWEGTNRERHAGTAVIALQLLMLCGELWPVFSAEGTMLNVIVVWMSAWVCRYEPLGCTVTVGRCAKASLVPGHDAAIQPI